MAKQSKICENYKHECNCELVDINKHHASLSDFPYTQEEITSIYDFYISHAPMLKNENQKERIYGLMSFHDYGWYGNSDLSKLERKLLNISGIPFFCMLKTDTITETAKELKLGDYVCIEHPRAIAMQNHTVKVHENNDVEITSGESRMVCLFRHIRNALCHNRIYKFENNYMLLEDLDNKGEKLSARIIINYSTLLDWINIVKKALK